MRTQWECLLQNLGEWQGSFTRFSPQGELVEDIPTVVSLEGLNDNQTIRQVVRRLPPNQPMEEKVLEYNSLGRQVLFFANGTFSQGAIQLGPFTEFGAELGLIAGERRLRLVQMFDKNGQLERLTLIREKLAGTTAAERPPLTVDALLGEWQGEAVTMYPDLRSPDNYPTTLRVERDNNQLVQQLTFGQGAALHEVSSTGRIDGSRIYFELAHRSRWDYLQRNVEEGSQTNQVLLLPDGASSTCPQQVRVRQAFFLEVGWLLQPDLRQRLIRRYDDKGAWSSLTLVTECRVKKSRF